MPLHRYIIGIRISSNSVGHIQTTIALPISNEKIQNFCSNSSSECEPSKTFRLHQKIHYRSKVIVETMVEGHFSTHFLSDNSSSISSQ